MTRGSKQFYLPAGKIDPFGNGAAKRSAQICSLLGEHFALENIANRERKFFPRARRYLSGTRCCLKHGIPVSSVKDISLAGHHFLNVKDTVESSSDSILFWESTLLTYRYCPHFFKQLGCRLIAFPHNIESLVPGQVSSVSGKTSPNWFEEELSDLRQCDHVFTISKEEEWLLSLFGVPCSWLPYYPTRNLEAELLAIRKFRLENKQEDFFLVLGSFFYQPIKRGIAELLDFVSDSELTTPLKIAGFGSEEVLRLYPGLPANVEVLGTVSAQEILELQRRCKGVIVSQQVSSGALTKLVELQLAGIPIIINHHSLRSYPEADGIMSFRFLHELPHMLNSDLTPPSVPGRPEKYYRQAVETISQFC